MHCQEKTPGQVSTARPDAKDKSSHYIDGELFTALVAEYRVSRESSLLHRLWADFFLVLAEHTVPMFVRKYREDNWVDTMQMEDLVQNVAIWCKDRIMFFQPDRGSAINFFTKVIENKIREFFRVWNKTREYPIFDWLEDRGYQTLNADAPAPDMKHIQFARERRLWS